MYDKLIYDGDILYDEPPIYNLVKRKGENKQIDINFSDNDLDGLCIYVTDMYNPIINIAALRNAKTFFGLLNKNLYKMNSESMAKIHYIQLILDAKVKENIDDENLIKNYIIMHCSKEHKRYIQDEIIDDIFSEHMSDSNYKYINSLIYDLLVDNYAVKYAERLDELFTKKDSGLYKSARDFRIDFTELMSGFSTELKDAEEYNREGKGFDLSTDNIKAEIQTIMKDLRAPSNKLQTGVQCLNKMLNGGFEAGRSYAFMGITGVGKSLVLLSCALWIMKYNKFTDLNGKKPALLFISQENSKSETFERIFNMNITDSDIRTYSDKDIFDAFKNSGLIVNSDSGNINFIFKYFDDKEISVQDIDDIINDYATRDIKIVCVIQDYIEKLRPKSNFVEERFALGSIATELSELAKNRRIPVITASQLNRAASMVIDNAIVNNKKNTTKLLGRSNISESWKIMQNIDASIIINREIDDFVDPPREYMAFKLEKLRGRPSKSGIFLFLHPFDPNNGIVLMDDVNQQNILSIFEIPRYDASSVVKKINNKTITKPKISELDNSFMVDYIDSIGDSYTSDSFNLSDIYNTADTYTEKKRVYDEIKARDDELMKTSRQKRKEWKNDVLIKNRKNKDNDDDCDTIMILAKRKK